MNKFDFNSDFTMFNENDEAKATNKIFHSMIDNAIDLFQKSVTYFKQDYKVSLICFLSACEIFLKARLVKINWRLIIKRAENFSIEKFYQGKFTSINFENALKLIQKHEVDHSNLKNLSLNDLRNIRNRIIHSFINLSEEDYRQDIVSQQLIASYFLQRLLRNQWHDYFKDYTNELNIINQMLQQFREYLEIKYKNLEPELDKISNKVNCIVCNYNSAVPEKYDHHQFTKFSCKICEHHVSAFKYFCMDCDTEQIIGTDVEAICCECKCFIKPEDIYEWLSKDTIYKSKAYDYQVNAEGVSCGYCDGEYDCIVVDNNTYFCCNCFTLAIGYSRCESCSEVYSGKDTYDEFSSYVFGCRKCKGLYGDSLD